MIGENNFISKQIDTFRLITELSSGELNSTYKAEQVQSSPRVVVFKLFHAVHLPEMKQERFLQEIRLLKKVRHPHILPVLSGGFYEDSPYIVSEYAARGSLRDRLNGSTTQFLPMQEAIAIIAEIGRALQFFHQINITHRNLKPENILFNKQGEMLLADSSIVTIEDSVPIERAHNTNTFPYMAPEQFHGRANKESDEYALGCVAYELLTGIAPFAGSAFKPMAGMHASEVLVPPTQLNMLLPIYLQEAILTAMAKQEANRFPHIKDFVAALTSSTRAQNAAIIVLSPSAISPSHAHYEPSILQQPQEDSEVTALQENKPPDTPIIVEDIEPVAPQEPVPVLQSQTFVEEMDSPPNTLDTLDAPDIPPLSVENVKNNEHPAWIETNAEVAEDSPIEYDMPTKPNLEAVSPQNNAPASAGYLMNGEEHSDRGYGAGIPDIPGIPAEAAQAAPNFLSRRNAQKNQLPLSKNLVLLVGISWAIIAVLILSMVFIIIPSAHTLTNVVSTIVQKPTPHPTLQPEPTAHPTAMPTAHPTPTPMPSPTPDPTPTPTVTPGPTPSPSPITIPVFTVSPTSLNGPTDCISGQLGFRCTVTVSLPQNYPHNAHWSASSSGNITAFFAPKQGTLAPGQQQTVNIVVLKPCTHNSSFIFSTADTKAVVSWSC
ncbi:MAG: serine/threonine-protein kinase [Ktedonobacteraceae bacterium]